MITLLKKCRDRFFKGKSYARVKAGSNLKLSPVSLLLFKPYLSELGVKGRKTSLLPVCLFLGFLVPSVALPPELLNCIYSPSASCSLDSPRPSTYQPAVAERNKYCSAHRAHGGSRQRRGRIKMDFVLYEVTERCSL